MTAGEVDKTEKELTNFIHQQMTNNDKITKYKSAFNKYCLHQVNFKEDG